MQDALIQKIAERIAVNYKRLSIVGNTDGLLTQAAVCQRLSSKQHLTIVGGSNLHLRIHYELEYKADPTGRYVYVSNDPDSILPDMSEDAYITNFSITDLFPLFENKPLLRRQSCEVLSQLYGQCANRHIGFEEGKWMIDHINDEFVHRRMTSAEHFRKQLADVNVDWDNASRTIENVCGIMNEAIENGVYDKIAEQIASVNDAFQTWVDNNYFAQLHANPLLHPKSVNGILPYLSHQFKNDDKVALVVVDGFCYWQWLLLRDTLDQKGIHSHNSTTLAWLPTITMLSRQAIFRGDTPQQGYKQSTDSESRMWRDWWQKKGLSSFAIQYISNDKNEFAINEDTRRLAYVTVEMDKKMHSSTDYADLYDLTRNWCPRIVEKLEVMLRMGFHVFLTTDHGGVLSTGWRSLTQTEKVFLFKDGSRGKRHLIYQKDNTGEMFRFAKDNTELRLLQHDEWLAMRDSLCFDTAGAKEITHGGSHFLEVVIPFIEIY